MRTGVSTCEGESNRHALRCHVDPFPHSLHHGHCRSSHSEGAWGTNAWSRLATPYTTQPCKSWTVLICTPATLTAPQHASCVWIHGVGPPQWRGPLPHPPGLRHSVSLRASQTPACSRAQLPAARVKHMALVLDCSYVCLAHGEIWRAGGRVCLYIASVDAHPGSLYWRPSPVASKVACWAGRWAALSDLVSTYPAQCCNQASVDNMCTMTSQKPLLSCGSTSGKWLKNLEGECLLHMSRQAQHSRWEHGCVPDLRCQSHLLHRHTGPRGGHLELPRARPLSCWLRCCPHGLWPPLAWCCKLSGW